MGNKKMIKTTSFILLILLGLSLITGCGSFQSGRNEPPVSAEFAATGTEGIVMQFVPDQPPAKIYTQSPLTFLVEVRNRGTYTVPNAMFFLTGYDPNIIRGMRPSEPLQGELEGKSQFNPQTLILYPLRMVEMIVRVMLFR